MFWNPRNIYPKGGFTSSRGEANDAKPVAAPAAQGRKPKIVYRVMAKIAGLGCRPKLT